MSSEPSDCFRLNDVEKMTSLTGPTIARFLADGRFPEPIAAHPIRRWSRSDVENWIGDRCENSGKDRATSELIKLDAVIEATGYSYSTIYRRINKRQFRSPVRLSVKRVAWLKDEIQEWVHARIKRADLL